MILLIDKYSHKKKLYAPKGAKLRLISERGNVLIVEYNGEKFSVNKKDVRHETNVNNCQ